MAITDDNTNTSADNADGGLDQYRSRRSRYEHEEFGDRDKANKAGAASPPPPGPPPRTVYSKTEIILSETTINDAAITAMQGLAEAKVPIYQRSGRLVRPASAELFDAEGRIVKTTVLVELNATYLKAVLAKYFTWKRKTRVKEENGKIKNVWKYVNPGWDVPNLILAMRGEWPFPTVTGILSAPTLRADGTLLNQEGLDVRTGLLLINLPEMPEVKEKPSREEALEALKLLKELLKEFPFLDEPSRVVALSLVLSMMVRGALGQVPLHLFTAPAAGSGKSLLTDIASMIATGRRAAVVAAASRLDEQEKRIAAAMLSGRPLVALDNLTGVLTSSLLCQAVSQPVVAYRKMGGDTEIDLECRSVFAANGNNIAIAGDLGRRTLFARLDVEVEKPWERAFEQKPLEMIARDRGRYIAAALTIPLAYLAAGSPRRANTVANGFEEWTHFVRDALVWLDEADVASTMNTARDGDPDLQATLAMFAAMTKAFGTGQDAARTAAQIIEASILSLDSKLSQQERLHDALEGITPAGTKQISAHQLGSWLRAAKGQIVGGMRLCKNEDRTSTGMWWIEKAKE
jgi:putative DNA primase/helicase